MISGSNLVHHKSNFQYWSYYTLLRYLICQLVTLYSPTNLIASPLITFDLPYTHCISDPKLSCLLNIIFIFWTLLTLLPIWSLPYLLVPDRQNHWQQYPMLWRLKWQMLYTLLDIPQWRSKDTKKLYHSETCRCCRYCYSSYWCSSW